MVTYDTGVINEDIKAPEAIHSGLNDSFRAFLHGHAIIAGNSGTAGLFNRFDDLVSGVPRGPFSIKGSAYIIDDYPGTLGSHTYGMGATQAITGTRDDSDSTF
jgi:hypothetical protein